MNGIIKVIEKFSKSIKVDKNQLNVMTIIIPEDSIFIDMMEYYKNNSFYTYIFTVSVMSAGVIYSIVKHFQMKKLLYEFDELKYQLSLYEDSEYEQSEFDSSDEDNLTEDTFKSENKQSVLIDDSSESD
jgi:acyl-coenzyme A synthetase/AMP-(fatty) acid ligase